MAGNELDQIARAFTEEPPLGWPMCPVCRVEMRSFESENGHGISLYEGRNLGRLLEGNFPVNVFACPQCYLVQLYGRDKPEDDARDAKLALGAVVRARIDEIEAEWVANPERKNKAEEVFGKWITARNIALLELVVRGREDLLLTVLSSEAAFDLSRLPEPAPADDSPTEGNRPASS